MRSLSVAAALVTLALGPFLSHAQEPAPAPATPPPATPTPATPTPATTPPAQPTPAQPTPATTPPATPAQPTPATTPPATPAQAQPKAAPQGQPKTPPKVSSVCPGKVLPLAVGNVWTYETVQAVLNGIPVSPPENMTRLLPHRPVKIVVTVTGVETKGTDTTVKMTEKITYDITRDPKTPKIFDMTVESSIVCSPKGRFDISPESFFFAGEPGGFRGLEFTKFERKKETSLKLTNRAIGELEWIEEIVAEYQKVATKGSNAKLGGGKLEMERKFTPQPIENTATRFGTFRTERLGLTTTGRIMLDNKVALDGKPCTQKKLNEKKEEVSVPTEICELPANWIAQIWLSDNIGIVQTLNPYAHMFQLVDAKLN